ncbi:transporter substrate-binding domain-containing protein [Bdellovibrio sp. GT3]|uniref:transporter substrate-binding domain-containing protein n=1 Tax=Bdellovibrio sp. GT3 TaxID=3136282 RepID=UPI0030F15357
MKFWFVGVILLILSAPSGVVLAAERQEVSVGAYGFAPYYDMEKGRGIINDVLKQLNDMQKDFEFKLLEIPSRRRYQSFTERKIDMIFFEDPRWSWKGIEHYSLPLKIDDSEVYIAHRKRAKKQSYFHKLEGKRIAGIVGYHYRFAEFKTDEQFLRSKFDIILVNHNQATVRMVLNDRVDVGVVPLSYIRQYLRENPEKNDEILIGDKVDQDYDLRLIANPKAVISKERLTKLVEGLVKKPSYKDLF